ncbi:MAG: hypothetical protein H6Q38_2489 [Chloroflexi bacterium]|jgi:uncharacterized alkaline shock family protein YloU|nr:hypothetical protein [Chloroflexota bacterium]
MDHQSSQYAGTDIGKTTISPDVLLVITQLTTLQVSGVSRMSEVPGGVNRILRRGTGEGVHIIVKDDTVSADLYVILKNDVNMRDVSRNIQHDVSRAISEMVGMQVGRINIHIEDIDYPENTEA